MMQGVVAHASGIARLLIREVREVIPPTVFFFLSFLLLLATQTLVLEEHGIEFYDFSAAAIGALVVGKVVLIADKFRVVDRYPADPIVWNVMWKALIYSALILAFRYVEQIVRFMLDGTDFTQANRALLARLGRPHFWLVHLWLSVLLLAYCLARELIRKIGAEEMKRLVFGMKPVRGGGADAS